MVLFCILQVLAQLSNGYPLLRMAMGMYLTDYDTVFKLPVKGTVFSPSLYSRRERPKSFS